MRGAQNGCPLFRRHARGGGSGHDGSRSASYRASDQGRSPRENSASGGCAGAHRTATLTPRGGSEKIVDHDSENAQRTLVFQPFRGLIQLLQAELGILIKLIFV